MRSRVLSRPTVSIPGLALMAVTTIALVGMAAVDPLADLGATVLLATMVLVSGTLTWALWRRSHCVLTSEGVGAGLLRRRWLLWSDVTGFQRDSLNPTSVAIFATSRTSDRLLLFGVPFLPLLLDSPDMRELAVRRTLARLEHVRQEVTGDRTG